MYGWHADPVATHETLHGYVLRENELLEIAGLKCRASTIDLCLYSIHRAHGGAAGVPTTQIGDVPGRGEPGTSELVQRHLSRRFGALQIRGTGLTHAGMEMSRAQDFPVIATQEEFAEEPQPMPTSPAFRASHRRLISMEELRLLATASRPAICARLAQLATSYLRPPCEFATFIGGTS